MGCVAPWFPVYKQGGPAQGSGNTGMVVCNIVNDFFSKYYIFVSFCAGYGEASSLQSMLYIGSKGAVPVLYWFLLFKFSFYNVTWNLFTITVMSLRYLNGMCDSLS